MAFDERLAERVRNQIGTRAGLTEKKMFGGLGFLLHGNMSVGVHGGELIVRLDPQASDAALAAPGARMFDLTGRPMKGWLMVGADGLRDPASLARWVRRGLDYASSLPRK